MATHVVLQQAVDHERQQSSWASLLPSWAAPPRSTCGGGNTWSKRMSAMADDNWEVRAFEEDAGQWPPRSYTCSFCKRGFRTAQALGGHMNVHRRERANKLEQLRNNAAPTNSIAAPDHGHNFWDMGSLSHLLAGPPVRTVELLSPESTLSLSLSGSNCNNSSVPSPESISSGVGIPAADILCGKMSSWSCERAFHPYERPHACKGGGQVNLGRFSIQQQSEDSTPVVDLELRLGR